MKIRKVYSKDYSKIKNLFKRNNLKIINKKHWLNLLKKNPFLKNKKKWIMGWAMEQNKQIVGHVGNFPTKYKLNDKSYLCSVLHGWVVDKKYRSQSILLLKKFFMQKNVDLFLGTTTNIKAGKIMNVFNAKEIPLNSLNYSLFIVLNFEKIVKLFLKKKFFSFRKIIFSLFGNILFYILKQKLNYWETKFSNVNIIKSGKIDPKFNYIWKKIKTTHKNTLLFHRDKSSLKWHLDHFLKINKAWIFLSLKNKKVNGYAICIENINFKDGLKRAFLIDLISLDKDKKILINLIGASIKEAKKRNCDIFEFKVFEKSKNEIIKFFNPFERKLPNNPFYYKSNNYKLDKMLNKSIYWMPTYLDGDAIINL